MGRQDFNLRAFGAWLGRPMIAQCAQSTTETPEAALPALIGAITDVLRRAVSDARF